MAFNSRICVVYITLLFISLTQCDEIDFVQERNTNVTGPSVSVIRKCFCPADNIFINNECIPNATYITVVENINSIFPDQIPTSDATKIIVSELICAQSYFSVNFTKERWSFLPSGQIFHGELALIFDESKYCIEHYLDENDATQMEVSVCVPIPFLPRCCPDGKFDKNLNTCMEPNKDVSVSVSIGNSYFRTSLSSYANDITCQGRQIETTVEIFGENSERSHLKVNNEGIFLSLKPAELNVPNVYQSPEYCVSMNESNRAMTATYCYSDPLTLHLQECANAVCVRKCCPEGQNFDMNIYDCTEVDKEKQWQPTFYDASETKEVVQVEIDYVTTNGYPLCDNYFPISTANEPKDIYRLLSNGSLYMENWGYSLMSYQYCIDNFMSGQNALEEAMTCFLPAMESKTEKCKLVENTVYPVLLTISCVFLVITLAVYAIIPELHAKVQGKCLISNVSSLLAAYIALVTVELASNNLSLAGCTAFGLLTQYSLLSSFFWLNVMCFDIWRTLRSMKGRESPSSSRRRFRIYSLYAWGCPLLICSVTIIMHLLPENGNDWIIRPGFGVTRCFFPLFDKKALWVYFYGFILIILLVNSIFFAHLAWKLLRVQKLTENTLRPDQKTNEWAKLYLKLFLIMGVTWIFEAASWVGGSCGFWIVTDIINALRGLLIFIIFVCKKDVIKNLRSESTPAFSRMRATVRQGSSFFSRSTSTNKRTSSIYIDPSSCQGAGLETGLEENVTEHHDRDVAM